MNSGKQIPNAAKATFWIFVCNTIQKCIGMLTVPIITRLLGTEEYGKYSVFVSWGNILIIIATLRLYSNGYYVGMKKYGHDADRYLSAISGLTFTLITTMGLVLILFNKELALITGLNFFELILLIVWIYGQDAIELWLANSRYTYRYSMIVVVTLFVSLATPILKILLIYYAKLNGYDGGTATILAFVIPVFFAGIVSWIEVLSRSRVLFVKEYWKFAFEFNLPLLPFYLSQTVLHHSDRIMIERIRNASLAGIYGVAYSLATAVSVIIQSVNASLSPWQFQKMKEGVNISSTVSKILVGITSLFFCFSLATPEVMRLYAAKEYQEAIYVVPLVVEGMLATWITQLFLNVEYYYEKNKVMSFSSIVSAVLNIGLNAVFIPRYGYIAAAYTTLVCFGLNMVLHGFVASSLCRSQKEVKPFNIGVIVVCFLLSVFGMIISSMLFMHPLSRYIVMATVLIFIGVYFKTDIKMYCSTIVRKRRDKKS